MEELKSSLNQYNEQLCLVREAIKSARNDGEREPLQLLQSELLELIRLTQESLTTLSSESTAAAETATQNDIDEEYELFMQEMASSGAYETNNKNLTETDETKDKNEQDNDDSDIENDLSTLLGMKCAVYHMHKWGGQPTLHNAMVSTVVPHQEDDQFNDLQVQILFTHPTHAEMLPCPFYLDGECRFDDEKCRYSHGDKVRLSELKEAIEPNFESIKIGSRILIKLKPPDKEDISLTKKTAEIYHLWHRAIVKSVDFEKKMLSAVLEHGLRTGEKRKAESEIFILSFEEIFPLHTENGDSTDSDDSISDTEYPESKAACLRANEESNTLLMENCLPSNVPGMGEWERHTRGIGSKLMMAMGYVPGTGLGATGEGRVQPVDARVLPVGKSLDHCMAISEKAAAQDPLKVEQKLRRIQQKEEQRNKRAYEREKEREKRNVFNFLNKTLGNKQESTDGAQAGPSSNIKQSSSKDLNIECFKITEDVKKIEREIAKLNNSLTSYPPGSEGHRNLNSRILEKNKEMNVLKNKERQIAKEQNHRKTKQNLTVF